jgi:hypothetical protein
MASAVKRKPLSGRLNYEALRDGIDTREQAALTCIYLSLSQGNLIRLVLRSAIRAISYRCKQSRCILKLYSSVQIDRLDVLKDPLEKATSHMLLSSL